MEASGRCSTTAGSITFANGCCITVRLAFLIFTIQVRQMRVRKISICYGPQQRLLETFSGEV